MTFTRRNILASLATAAALFTTGSQALQAQAYCAKGNRECLVFISNLTSKNMSYAQKKFYQWVEFGAEALAVSTLSPKYNKVHVVRGAGATRAALSNNLRMIANIPSVRAVDLIFVTHGLSGSVVFSDQETSMSNVRWDIRNKISYSKRKKLRMVFNTACYGSTHNYYWRNAGFEVTAGSRRIYADSVVSYVPFLLSWATNHTFGTAITMANLADPARVTDNIGKSLLKSWGYSKWWDVDSFRITSGRTSLRIYHRPY